MNKNIFDELEKNNDPIIIFGAGREGRRIGEYLIQNHGFKNRVCFCDNFKGGFEEFTGAEIISPSMLEKEYKNAYIMICVCDPDRDQILLNS